MNRRTLKSNNEIFKATNMEGHNKTPTDFSGSRNPQAQVQKSCFMYLSICWSADI